MNALSLPWSALRQLALAGTHARPLPAALPPSAADLDAHQVLLAAGTLARTREVAWQPLPGARLLPPLAPAETQPVIDATGEHLLRKMLDGYHSHLLHEFYLGLAARGYRVPHSLVAAVLADQATNSHGPDEHLASVLGERGRWLAQLNPAWRKLIATADATTWASDSYWRRRQFLHAFRQAAPAQARAFLTTHLPQVPTDDQAQLLRELAWHLEPADEPLLTHYLGSDSAEVRRVVAPLLARLPGNWLVEKLWEYAQPFLTLVSQPDGKMQLLVRLPPHWEARWQQVGIERWEYGVAVEPLGWVRQMLELIPPQRWADHWQLTPSYLLKLAATTPEATTLLAAWAAATKLHEQVEWAAALVEGQLTGALPTERIYSPAHVLPAQLVETLVLPHVPAGAQLSDTPAPWQQILKNVSRPWSEAVVQRILQLLDDSLFLPRPPFHGFRAIRSLLIRDLTSALAPAHYELVAQRLHLFSQTRSDHQEMVESCYAYLQFQQQLTHWLANLPPVA